MNKTFLQIYQEVKRQPTPAAVFAQRIMQATGASRHAVESWLLGRHTPRRKDRETIAALLGGDEQTLFPKTKNAAGAV